MSDSVLKCPKCGGTNSIDSAEEEAFTVLSWNTKCSECGHADYFDRGEYESKKDTTTTRADEIIERQGQKIVKQAEQIQRMEANALKLIGNFQQACVALLEIADYADKEPFDMRDLKLIAIASDCLGMG